ncbi:MAG: hypothetical protein L3J42_05870 [Hydrogenimonas sp.]|nr:hypothetical protein [Hydrogenimonas sp.]
MKFFIIILLMLNTLFAKVYYAKVEPFELRIISSNVSGLIIQANEDLIGKVLSSKPYIKIDSIVDTKELKYIKNKLNYIQETINVNERILENLEKDLKRKRENYKKVQSLKFKSSVEKDRLRFDFSHPKAMSEEEIKSAGEE